MTFTKDNITYPTEFDEAIKDKRINKAFVSHTKDVAGYENVAFMLIDFDPQIHFRKFIAENAPAYVNISSVNRKPFLELAEDQNWALADWRGHLENARHEIREMIDSNYLKEGGFRSFYKSKRFELIHMDLVKKAEGAPTIPAKTFIHLAKMVGYENPLDILRPEYSDDKAMVEQLLFHDSRGEKTEAKALLGRVKKRVQKRNAGRDIVDTKHDTVERTLASAEMFAEMEAADTVAPDDPGNYEIEIDLDKKKLEKSKFGFETDRKSLSILNTVVTRYVNGDQPEAKKAFELLKKRYDKGHPIHHATVKTIILTLKREKLIDFTRPV